MLLTPTVPGHRSLFLTSIHGGSVGKVVANNDDIFNSRQIPLFPADITADRAIRCAMRAEMQARIQARIELTAAESEPRNVQSLHTVNLLARSLSVRTFGLFL